MRSMYFVYASAINCRISVRSAVVARRIDVPLMPASLGCTRALNTEMLAHRHGRRPRSRRARPPRGHRIPATPGGSVTAVPGADEQFDLHAPRLVRAAQALGTERARGLDLDVRPGHRVLPRESAAPRVGARPRRGRPPQRDVTGAV